NRSGRDHAVRGYRTRLSDAMRAIDRLAFYRGIPPRIVEDDVVRRRERQAYAAGLERTQEHRRTIGGHEALHLGLTVAIFGRAVQVAQHDIALLQRGAHN